MNFLLFFILFFQDPLIFTYYGEGFIKNQHFPVYLSQIVRVDSKNPIIYVKVEADNSFYSDIECDCKENLVRSRGFFASRNHKLNPEEFTNEYNEWIKPVKGKLSQLAFNKVCKNVDSVETK